MSRVFTLHMPQFLNAEDRIFSGKKGRKMGAVKMSSLPVIAFRRESTTPVVTITDNGQLRLNKLAASAITDQKFLVIAEFDPKSRNLKLVGVNGPPKGWTEDDMFKVNRSEKGGVYTTFTRFLAWSECGYDYKGSGSAQNFTAEIDGAKHSIAIKLPKGKLEAKPVAARQKKAKPVTAAAPANSGAAASAEPTLEL